MPFLVVTPPIQPDIDQEVSEMTATSKTVECRHGKPCDEFCQYCHGCEDDFGDALVLYPYIAGGAMRHPNRRHMQDVVAGHEERVMVASLLENRGEHAEA